jgi:hypothetical protein
MLLAAIRAVGVKHEAFQAVAHLWVGGLLGAWIATRSWFYLRLALTLSAIEVVCFFLV